MMTYKRLRAFFLATLLCLTGAVGAFAQTPSGDIYYLNLSKGDVIMRPDGIDAWIWLNNKWTHVTNGYGYTGPVFWILMDPDNKFNGNPSSLANYQRPVTTTMGGSVNIVNNTDVVGVINAWESRASAQGRPSTTNRILVACNSGYTILLDNIWCTYQDYGQSRYTGGLAYYPQQDGAKLNVYLKGDNRFGNIFYSSSYHSIHELWGDHEGYYQSESAFKEVVGYFNPDDPTLLMNKEFENTKLRFYNSTEGGTLTVANISPTETFNTGGFTNLTYNFYDSAIGGSDVPYTRRVDKEGWEYHGKTVYYYPHQSAGIEIRGGTIFAGTQPEDVCTAIGGGGNGFGGVTITAGTVTAVTSSTGTAIGGGIGWTNVGGDAKVKITGGTVYAYNHGIVREYDGGLRYVPAAAIGGGSSFRLPCHPCEVEITGGTVYAQSVGGVAIGGGGSATMNGGVATIKITGGTITAKSVSGSQNGVSIPYGSAIGGGVGGTGIDSDTELPAKGGDCTFTMTGGKLMTGSVGGGATNNPEGKIGFAKASISGANTDIQAQFIMAKGSDDHCEFKMTAGKLHDSNINSSEFKLVKQDGGALWLDDPNGVVNITGGSIENCQANNGGAVYTTGGSVTVKNATITQCKALTGNGGAFAVMADGANVTLNTAVVTKNTAVKNGGAFYLAKNADVTITKGTIDDNKATQDGGAFYGSSGSTITLNSGSIERNEARNGGGVYLESGAKLTYTTSASATETGYIRANHASNLGGGVYLAKGTTSKKTILHFNLNSPSLGFYDNIAEVGADDIYAYGEGTTNINIPDVTTMDLGGYSLQGATLQWWEDYRVDDSRYDVGTLQGDPNEIRRYRASRDVALPIWKVPKVEGASLEPFYEKYLCLTVGYEYGSIEIRRNGLKPKESTIYKIEFIGDDLDRPAQYVSVYGTEEEDKVTFDGKTWNFSRVGFLPKGTYKVTELTWSWYDTDKTAAAKVKTQDISTDTGRIYKFSNDHEDLGTAPLHDEEHKVNDLKP